MLFSEEIHTKNHKNSLRKEKDSFLANKNMSKTSIITSKQMHKISPKSCVERASLCTLLSFRKQQKKASVTVEASLAVPLYFFALLCILYLLEIITVQMSVRTGMHSAMDTIVEEVSTGVYLSSNQIAAEITDAIGTERLDNSIVYGGSSGLDCSDSNISILTGIVELEVSYQIELPVPKFGFPTMTFQENLRAKSWTGYVAGVSSSTDEIVYITDNASVYHLDINCTHLDLEISSATYSDLDALKNEYGSSYDACAFCMANQELTSTSMIYVAANGDAYHSTLSCSGLKRTIYAVSLSEVIGKGVCTRCGQ